MDRNTFPENPMIRIDEVALRKESVDRNLQVCIVTGRLLQSLSARRAWIEIPAGCWRDARRAVALRKESVDRNGSAETVKTSIGESLSARRAWIEIPTYRWQRSGIVSLSARRAWIEI